MQRIYEGLAQLFYSAREDERADDAKAVVDEAAPARVYPAETVFDDVPTAAAGATLTIERLCAEQLASGRYEGDGLVAAVRRNGFAVIRLSDAQHGVVARMFEQMAAFLRQPAAVKQRSFGRYIEGCRCGWELVDFPNEDNKRWPETRDAFSISPRFAAQTPWPSAEFAAAALDLLALYTQLADAVLAQLAVELQCPVEHLTRLAAHEPKPSSSSSSSSSSSDSSGDDALPMTAQRDSEQSNLTLFRYQDDDGVLPAPQKCMIHQDSGLVTLLARATVPGLEVLLPDRSAFVDTESLLDARDVVVYFGKAMKRVTRGVVPATFHRVVRQPATERLSMPFELKPNNAAALDPIASSPLVQQRAADLVDDDPVSFIALHPNICNGCGLFVEGTLYRCRSCEDFDFCRSCYDEYSRGGSVDNVHPDRAHAFSSSNDATWNFQRYDSRLNGWEFLKSIQHVRSANRAWRFRQLAGQ